MTELGNLTNHFLIAMPSLADPNFNRTVIYVCEHNENGALGLIINQPLELDLGQVFEQMQIKSESPHIKSIPVFFGGPVQQQRGFVLHPPCGEWRSTLAVSKDIAITTSQDILEAISQDQGPKEIIIALGYAGWSEKQLETEIMNNSWLSCPANSEILFKTPHDKRWEAAAALLGIDINSLSGEVGHA